MIIRVAGCVLMVAGIGCIIFGLTHLNMGSVQQPRIYDWATEVAGQAPAVTGDDDITITHDDDASVSVDEDMIRDDDISIEDTSDDVTSDETSETENDETQSSDMEEEETEE